MHVAEAKCFGSIKKIMKPVIWINAHWTQHYAMVGS